MHMSVAAVESDFYKCHCLLLPTESVIDPRKIYGEGWPFAEQPAVDAASAWMKCEYAP